MPLPEHLREIPVSRRARAPYNFVPLPEQVVPAEECSPAVGREPADRLSSGRIVCTLTTSSPLYIRAAALANDYAAVHDQPYHQLPAAVKARQAAFFHHGTADRPVLPGSSLRGMLRNLVEIAAYGKIDRVSERKLFARSPAATWYRDRFSTSSTRDWLGRPTFCSLARAGIFRRHDDHYWIDECSYARIERMGGEDNPRGTAAIPVLGPEPEAQSTHQNGVPNQLYQGRTIYVTVGQPRAHLFPRRNINLHYSAVQQASFTPFPGSRPATLVLSGQMPNKCMEFVFLHDGPLRSFEVTEAMVQVFEHEDQITKWQQSAFPAGNPPGRSRDGYLRDGEPVFFLLNEQDQVDFFGRAGLFRFPYKTSARDRIPAQLRARDPIDIAEAVFGVVRSERLAPLEGQPAIAGRVSVSDARLVDAPDGLWLSDAPITPPVLSAPKPTTYQHYLVQQSHIEQELLHYDDADNATVIRGHKLYWHKGAVPVAPLTADPQRVAQYPTQYSAFRPLKAGVSFCFEVHYEQLTQVELGALLWVLQLAEDPRYRLKLGMGKPLGMGAVAIQTHHYQLNPAVRYGSLFDDRGELVSGETDFSEEDQYAAITAFAAYVLEKSGEAAAGYTRLSDTPRLQSLLALLSWPGPGLQDTRSLRIGGEDGNAGVNEFARRPVLPHAQHVPLRPSEPHRQQPLPAARRAYPLPQPVLAPAAPVPAAPTPQLPTTESRQAQRPPSVGQARKDRLLLTGSYAGPVTVSFQRRRVQAFRINLDLGQLAVPDQVDVVCFTAVPGTGTISGRIHRFEQPSPTTLLIEFRNAG